MKKQQLANTNHSASHQANNSLQVYPQESNGSGLDTAATTPERKDSDKRVEDLDTDPDSIETDDADSPDTSAEKPSNNSTGTKSLHDSTVDNKGSKRIKR